MANVTRIPATIVGFALICCIGCATTVTTRVLRPALINAQPYGGTMTVGEFRGDQYEWNGIAADIRQYIREAIVGCPNGVVRFMEGQAGLTVFGRVADYTYRELVAEQRDTCTRTEGSGSNRREVRYACVHYTRNGEANVRIVFNVADGAGQTIAAKTYEMGDSASTFATDQPPSAIDGQGMLRSLAYGLTDQFIRVVIPWWDTVDLPFWDCGDSPDCTRGIGLVQAGQWDQAITAFDAAAAKIQATPGFDPEDLAEAYWNKALTQQYSNDFAGAVISLTMAMQLDPENSDYAAQLQEVQRSQADMEALRQQGIGGGTTDNVQQGGTP